MVELCILVSVLSILALALIGAYHLLRAATSPVVFPRPEPSIFCRHCGKSRPAHGICHHCRLNPAQAERVQALHSTLAHLTEFHDANLLDEPTFVRLRDALWAREAAIIPVRPAPRRPAPPPVDEVLEVIPVEPVKPAAADKPVEVLPAPEPPPPRRPWSEVLAAFMEDRHILWGELVGGLLIVGCSVALVLSLWQIPLFPFLLLAALFGAGRYTL